MKPLFAFIAAALAGCSISPERASVMSSYDLCRIANAPISFSREDAMRHLAARDENCDRYRAMMFAEQQANMQTAATGAQLMINSRTYHPQAPIYYQQEPQQVIIQQPNNYRFYDSRPYK